jgi:hypothetical protein
MFNEVHTNIVGNTYQTVDLERFAYISRVLEIYNATITQTRFYRPTEYTHNGNFVDTRTLIQDQNIKEIVKKISFKECTAIQTRTCETPWSQYSKPAINLSIYLDYVNLPIDV